jgi:putative zinc finger/helix-turn-helix YgiT family protein
MEKKWTCSACGADSTRLTKGSYVYKESGLTDVTLSNVELIHCDNCQNEDPIIANIEGLHALIADALIKKPARLKGQELRFLRKHLELTARRLAGILHVDPATISKWENEEDPVGPQSDLLMRALVHANSQGNLAELQKNLEAFDMEGSIPGITCDIPTSEVEYS